jgi:zinc protease
MIHNEHVSNYTLIPCTSETPPQPSPKGREPDSPSFGGGQGEVFRTCKEFTYSYLCGCLCVLFSLGFLAAEVGAQHAYQDLTFPEFTFALPDIIEHTLDNGLRLFLVEDSELPVIRLYALISAGGIYEPADQVGLAALAAEVMRTGGTAAYSADDIDETLEFLASRVEVDLRQEYGVATAWTLTKNFDATLDVFADLLRRPAFAEDKLELAKARALETIRRRNDYPADIAGRELLRLIYGPTHPLARIPQPADIRAITRDDVISFYHAWFHPNAIMLGVTGDFNAADMLAALEAAFGDWPRSDARLPTPALPDVEALAAVNLIAKDVEQTTLMLGHRGIRADHPDYAAVTVLDLMLGSGGFSSRLYRRVRSELGLAYAVGSQLGAGMRADGAFMLYCAASNERVGEALRAILAEIHDLRDREVSHAELEAARNQYLNSFVFRFEHLEEVVRRQMLYAYFDYPADFLITFRERVAHVTAADVQRAARAHLRPDDLTILAVGAADAIRPALTAFGEIRELELDPVD